MRVSLPPHEINGDPPPLIGASLDEILCQEFWYEGQLSDAVNSMYLSHDGLWTRLFFDHGIVFWRPQDRPPVPFDAPEIEGRYELIDIGVQHDLKNREIKDAEISGDSVGSLVRFVFSGGHQLKVRGLNDDSTSWTAA